MPAGVPVQNDSNLVSAWETRGPVDPSVEKKMISARSRLSRCGEDKTVTNPG